MILLAASKGLDQTARMRKLIWSFAVRICQKKRFRMTRPTYRLVNVMHSFCTIFVGDCGTLSAPEHGTVTYSDGTSFESVARYSCHPDYILSYPASRTCLSNGRWSEDAPTCDPIGMLLSTSMGKDSLRF